MSAVQFPQHHYVDWFETFSGLRVRPMEPDHAVICIEDIAHALSNCCRFAGHCYDFYSVGTHSMFVYMLVKAHTDDIDTLKYALLHDAAEAYIHDITRPLKRSYGMEWYKELETKWEIQIAMAFGIDLEKVDFQLVKEADNHALKKEAERLVLSQGKEWGIPETREFPIIIVGTFHFNMTPKQTRDAFIRKWDELDGRH